MASSPRSPARSPASGFRSPLPPEAPKESAVSRLLIAPLTFVSFLLSLALIDSRNHSLRTHSHSPSRLAPTTFLGRTNDFLHSLIFKPTPSSPYAYIKSPNSQASAKAGGGAGEKGKEKEPWHWHTKQRHMMAAEMDDAFRVRKWVVVFLVCLGVAVAFCGTWIVMWIVNRGFYVWRNWEKIETAGPIHINRPTAIRYGEI